MYNCKRIAASDSSTEESGRAFVASFRSFQASCHLLGNCSLYTVTGFGFSKNGRSAFQKIEAGEETLSFMD